MSKKLFKSVTCLFLVMSLVSLHGPQLVRAEMIGVQKLLEVQQRVAKVDKTRDFLQRENVREQLMLLGANPDEVSQRLEALSDNELNLLARHISELPAGAGAEGLLVVIGVVFIVLIILDLVGATNVFTRL